MGLNTQVGKTETPKMRPSRGFGYAIACLAAFVSPVGMCGALIDRGTYTTDMVTALDWLDLTQTNGLSHDNVRDLMMPGQALEGWRFATRTEVVDFWTNAGGQGPFTGAANGELDWVGNLQLLWGKTYPFVYSVGGYTVQGSIAMTADESSTCATCNLTVYLLNNLDINDSSVGDYAEAVQLNEAHRWEGQVPIGHALVRESVTTVPEPSAFGMASIALLGLGVARRVGARKAQG